MKSVKFFAVICVLGAMICTSCKTINKGDRMPDVTNAKIDSISYAYGVWIGENLKGADFGEMNLSKVEQGIFDVLADKATMTEMEMGEMLNSYYKERMTYANEKRLKEGEEFLAKNKTAEGVVETESGLQYRIDAEGAGEQPASDQDTVMVCYKGSLLDGKVFDSSYDRNDTTTFVLGRVIKGWSEGLKLMKEGSKATLWIPANLGYGERPMGRDIPANSMLTFEVELVKVKHFVEAPATKK